MQYKITRYENFGEGYIKTFDYIASDREAKNLVKTIEEHGFKRVKGSGIIGLSYEGITEDKMGKAQITIQRVAD